MDRDSKRSEWIGAAILLARFPVLQTTTFQAGVEQLWLRDLIQDEAEMLATGITTETGDANSINIAVQMSNSSDYMGYKLTTQLGVRYGRLSRERIVSDGEGFKIDSEQSNTTTSFLTVYAGIQ